MTAPKMLQQALSQLLGDASLCAETLPGTDLRLWLIDAGNMDCHLECIGTIVVRAKRKRTQLVYQ